MTPHRSILDPKFRYYDSASTNIRLAFARERRRQKRLAAGVPAVFRHRRAPDGGQSLD